jgi:hypothetical protein
MKMHPWIVAMGIMAAMDRTASLGRGLRAEIAAAAASLIAEEGLDYATAKRKAYERITGARGSRIAKESLPSNDEIEDAVREYQQIFLSDSQPARLADLRRKALALMELLADFSPAVSGAIVNGTAGDHSDIHLQCFTDNAKDLGIFMLNQNIRTEAASLPNFRPGAPDVEALVIQWQQELAVIAVHPEHDMRGALKADADGRRQRLDIAGFKRLIAETD